jgi:hypothetical protein
MHPGKDECSYNSTTTVPNALHDTTKVDQFRMSPNSPLGAASPMHRSTLAQVRGAYIVWSVRSAAKRHFNRTSLSVN